MTGHLRNDLATLAREYLLAGHLIDRSGMPQVIGDLGQEAMGDIAIDEWMAASPVYTRRMQQALRFEGDDVATIFKGMQFDIGAPPQFMDFRYRVDSADYGEFWLASCGALLDVEPMGEDYVVTMCHHIEDPTFDATACATNRRARVRPLHRPPREPADRHPHCHWTVRIDDAAEPLSEPEVSVDLARSEAARLAIPVAGGTTDDGMQDYSGEFEPELQLARFSASALAVVLDEVCLQGQLLNRAFLQAVERRADAETTLSIGCRQFTGIAGLTARRLVRHLQLAGDAPGVARLLEAHPAFRPSSYVAMDVSVRDETSVRVALQPCLAFGEGDDFTWMQLLVTHDDRALAAMVREVNPRAVCRRVDPSSGEVAAWIVEIDAGGDPAPEPPEVILTSFSTGADFDFG